MCLKTDESAEVKRCDWHPVFSVRYTLTSTVYAADGRTVTAFGIRADMLGEGGTSESVTVPDISCDYDAVRALLLRVERCAATPMTLRDIAEDFLLEMELAQ